MTTNDRVNPVSKSNNLNIFKQDAKYWIGSTGKLTPWNLNDNVNGDSSDCGGSSNDDVGQNNNNNGSSSSTTTSSTSKVEECFVCQKESNVHTHMFGMSFRKLLWTRMPKKGMEETQIDLFWTLNNKYNVYILYKYYKSRIL